MEQTPVFKMLHTRKHGQAARKGEAPGILRTPLPGVNAGRSPTLRLRSLRRHRALSTSGTSTLSDYWASPASHVKSKKLNARRLPLPSSLPGPTPPSSFRSAVRAIAATSLHCEQSGPLPARLAEAHTSKNFLCSVCGRTHTHTHTHTHTRLLAEAHTSEAVLVRRRARLCAEANTNVCAQRHTHLFAVAQACLYGNTNVGARRHTQLAAWLATLFICARTLLPSLSSAACTLLVSHAGLQAGAW